MKRIIAASNNELSIGYYKTELDDEYCIRFYSEDTGIGETVFVITFRDYLAPILKVGLYSSDGSQFPYRDRTRVHVRVCLPGQPLKSADILTTLVGLTSGTETELLEELLNKVKSLFDMKEG